MNGEGLFAVIGTIFGFLLFALWDIWKERKRKSEDRKRIIGLLKTELLDNLGICRNSKEILNSDLKSMEEKGTENLITPASFSESAWNIARAGDILSILNDEKLKKISQLYTGFRMINTVLVNRDMVRATSRALTSYQSIISSYNKVLINMISILETGINEVLKFLS